MADLDLFQLATEEGIEIAPGVRVRLRSLADYRQNEENPVSHTPRNAEAVLESIHKVGACRSGFAADGEILGGNLTWEMMAEVGIEGVVEVTTDGNQWVMVNRPDLTPEQRKQATYGDQQGSFLAGWELDQVLADVGAGVDLSGLLTDMELEAILGEALEVETGEVPEPKLDKGAELAEKYGVQVGQVWQLGEHRLAVGDCTDKTVVDAVMRDTGPAKLFATDPPYGCDAGNIGFTAQRDDIEAITKDDLQGEEMQAFLEKVFAMWIPYLAEDCAWYLWHPMLTQGYFAAAAAAADLIIHRQIIWRKEQFIFGRGDYHWRHELCFYGWRRGHRPAFYGERNQDTIWDVPWDIKRSEVGHPTAKPVMLFSIPMHNHLRKGEIAVEPFAGSGSQFVAGELFGVKVFGCEISPAYAAICIQRLADMGLEPKLLE